MSVYHGSSSSPATGNLTLTLRWFRERTAVNTEFALVDNVETKQMGGPALFVIHVRRCITYPALNQQLKSNKHSNILN